MNKFIMENYLIILFVVSLTLPGITIALVLRYFWKRYRMIKKELWQIGVIQNITTMDLNETIITVLKDRSKSQELTEDERERFHIARKMLLEAEKSLKKAGFEKKPAI